MLDKLVFYAIISLAQAVDSCARTTPALAGQGVGDQEQLYI